MFAIIEASGHQYKVHEGDLIKVNLLQKDKEELAAGSKVTFTQVLAVRKEDGSINLGAPFINAATVQGEVVEHGKEKKVYAFKMKRRKGYKKKQGVRRPFTLVKILGIKAA